MRRHEKAPQRAQRTEGLSNGAPLSGLTAHFRPFASGGPMRGDGPLPVSCNRTPNVVTVDITRDSPLLSFLPHTVCHLCYDGALHAYGS